MRQIDQEEVIGRNEEILHNINHLRTMHIKNQISLKKKIKKFERHKEQINQELNEELSKQQQLYFREQKKFETKINQLQEDISARNQEYQGIKDEFVQEKTANLNFIIEENDELEREILKLNENMLGELDQVEREHKKAI